MLHLNVNGHERVVEEPLASAPAPDRAVNPRAAL